MRVVFCCLLLLSSPLSFLGAAWNTEEKQAFETAKQENKPLLIAFLGTKWCPWSEKMQTEVLSQAAFWAPLEKRMVCLKEELPVGELSSLARKYGVSQVPTLVLLTPQGKEISTCGFLPQEPSEFAEHLIGVYNRYSVLVEALQGIKLEELSFEKLKHFYLLAGANHFRGIQQQLLEQGLKQKTGSFFLLEKYKERAGLSRKEISQLRREIMSRDPDNKEGAFLQMALADFLNKQEKKLPVAAVIKPLKRYLKEWGKKDKEHVWRVKMMLSQYLYNHGEGEKALSYALGALAVAPIEHHEDVREWIALVEGKKR